MFYNDVWLTIQFTQGDKHLKVIKNARGKRNKKVINPKEWEKRQQGITKSNQNYPKEL